MGRPLGSLLSTILSHLNLRGHSHVAVNLRCPMFDDATHRQKLTKAEVYLCRSKFKLIGIMICLVDFNTRFGAHYVAINF